MDFKSLVGDRVSVICKVDRISRNNYLTSDFLLLRDVYFNGDFFRNHLYVKRSKRLEFACKDDVLTFTAIVKTYLDVDDVTQTKLGLCSVRQVHKIVE